MLTISAANMIDVAVDVARRSVEPLKEVLVLRETFSSRSLEFTVHDDAAWDRGRNRHEHTNMTRIVVRSVAQRTAESA